MKKIGIIGAPCIDQIVSPSGEVTGFSLGGILYSYAVLERIARERNLEVTYFPFTLIAERDLEFLEPFFTKLKHFDFSHTPRSKDATTNRVQLIYEDEGKRKEVCSVILPEVTPEHLATDVIASLDGLFVNMISGYDISVTTMEWLRANTECHIHLDVHALTLGKLSESDRRFAPVHDWQRWALAANSVQLNEKEAIFFPPVGSGPYISQIRHQSKNDTTERSVILTRGEKDTIGYNITRSEKHIIPTRKLNTIDTTGSGDVFGAVYLLEHILGASMPDAISSANEWAGKNTLLKGVFELVG
ncbi:MAG TPA: carbohydrate kinase family protein [Candidatus Kapabacteria bacterium]